MVMSASAIAVVTGRSPQLDRDTADVSGMAGPRLARAATGRGSLFPTAASGLQALWGYFSRTPPDRSVMQPEAFQLMGRRWVRPLVELSSPFLRCCPDGTGM